MARPIDFAIRMFQYPLQVHVRRHGPIGYSDYQSYKPWLRDEFQFRCVYCLWRERWLAVGEDAFSVEHQHARAEAPDRVCDYDNLIYACCRCNSVKSDAHGVLDPCQQAYGEHLEIGADATVQGLTMQGRELIEICQLARPRITQARRRLLDLFRTLHESQTPTAKALLKHYLGYPDNLPILSRSRPPLGNSLPEGIVQSYHERAGRGELPDEY